MQQVYVKPMAYAGYYFIFDNQEIPEEQCHMVRSLMGTPLPFTQILSIASFLSSMRFECMTCA
uniref:Putative ovule protein n=1 Tax=Solanum chacoense TaxID=4108 RepID=A0A0V0H4H9_SOLCH